MVKKFIHQKKKMTGEREEKKDRERNKCGLENKVALDGQNGHFNFLIKSVTRQRLTGEISVILKK